jgi:hypothetical protein
MPDVHRIRNGSRGPSQSARGAAARWRAPGAVATALLLAMLFAACGSSSSAAPTSNAEVKRVCKQVEAALSDGPEPAADPVGYAQAQILPLRRIRTSDKRLHEAIDSLASAYAAFSAGNGTSRRAKNTVTAAVNRINAICPGGAS